MGRWFLGLALSLAMAGAACAATIPSDKLKGFTKGATTKAEVLASLGEPVKQAPAANGGSVLRYDWTSPPSADGKPPKDLFILFFFTPAGLYDGIQVFARNDAAVRPAAAPTPADARPISDLRDENVLTPLPMGFKIGAEGNRGQLHQVELIAAGETVDSWTRMITQQTLYGSRSQDPAMIATIVATSWTSSCRGGSVERVSNEEQNGYRSLIWKFVCPLNPASKKPETMWMKVISGADALYDVQYAYRRTFSADMAEEALSYLKTVSVCDTRTPAHPCPGQTAR